MVVASSADTLRRCVKHIAEGGTNERDLRNERRWPFDPGDCPGAGRVPQHGTPVPLPAQGQVLKSPEAMRPRPHPPRGSKLDPYAEHIDRRMGEGLENCRVLDREVRALGYQGSYSTVAQYVRPRRQHKQPEATMRFETAPGKLAQVDWGQLAGGQIATAAAPALHGWKDVVRPSGFSVIGSSKPKPRCKAPIVEVKQRRRIIPQVRMRGLHWRNQANLHLPSNVPPTLALGALGII